MANEKKNKINSFKNDEEEADEKDPLNDTESSDNIEKKEKDKKKDVSYFQLYRFATPVDKMLILLGIISSVICGITQPYFMLLFGDVTQVVVTYAGNIMNTTRNLTDEERKVLESDLYYGVQLFSIKLTIIGFIALVTTYLATVCFSYAGLNQIFKIRKHFLEKTLNQDISWYDVHKTGDFATTFTDNLAKIEEGIGEKVATFIFFETIFVTGIIMALVLGWQLALVCMISLPLTTIIMGLITFLSSKFTKQELEAYGSAGAIADEVISSVRTVIAFDGQEKEFKRYDIHLTTAKNNNVKKSMFNGISNGFLWFFVYGCYALSFWYGVGLILEEKMLPENEKVYTPGNMTAVFFCTLIAAWNFGSGAPYVEIFGNARAAATKVFDVLDNKPIINNSKNLGKRPKRIKSDIVFDNIYFNYPSRPDVKVLNGFNLKVKYGETVALVGSSGCGKSTCIQLIQRYYDPISGNILIDGNNIKDLNLTWLRDKIGVVGQEPALFATTISENIRYGNLDATQNDIEKAARKANAHQFIKSLPHGYETIIGERGAQLSGGQKQRIAIARALVREPEILLLDEATSALDTTSEAEVQAALDAISGECTTIIVAHRLSTIRNASRIIVVQEGRVIEDGTHAELMDSKGVYYTLVTSQGLSDTDATEEVEVEISKNHVKRRSTLYRKESKISVEKQEEQLEVEEKNESSILEVIKANKPEWFYILLGCLASVVTGAGLPVYGVVFGDIIGVLANNDDNYVREKTNLYCIYFVVLGVVTAVATFIQMYTFGFSGEKLTQRIRRKMFRCMLQQEMGWYDRKENGVGALCAKLSGEAASVQGASGVRIGTMLNSLSTCVIAATISLYYSWKLTLVLISFSPIIFLSIYFEQKFINSDAKTNQKILESSAKIAVEGISNIRTVVSLGCEEVFNERFVKELEPYQASVKRKMYVRAMIMGIARSVMFFAYAAGMIYGVELIRIEKLSYEIVFKVAEILVAGSWSIGTALSFSPNFQKGLQAAGRIFQLLKRVPEIRNVQNASKELWHVGNVDYTHVYFSYPTRPTVSVLNGLNLSIKKGQTVALVGSSGCGKSTIIQLLERFYDPISGEVTVDEQNTKNFDISTIRSQLGIVSQEPNLFDRTIAENIAYGDNKRKVRIDEIIEAARSANIHKFITSLPLGYDTSLGSKGTQLSGGQKQRIAIARALIRNPRLLLLDEATSALDNESEKIVQEALDNAKKGRTCITIAHRLTTIQDADVICVLKDGLVVEIGKHNELLEKKGLYFEFYKLQSGQK